MTDSRGDRIEVESRCRNQRARDSGDFGILGSNTSLLNVKTEEGVSHFELC